MSLIVQKTKTIQSLKKPSPKKPTSNENQTNPNLKKPKPNIQLSLKEKNHPSNYPNKESPFLI